MDAEAVNKMEAQKARWSEAALKKHPSDVTWTELASLGESDLRASLGVWGRVREAAAFSLQMYWTAIVHQRATNTFNGQRGRLRKFEAEGWKSPYQSEADATEQAHRFADGDNRQFLRVLRQMRDLRRYAPPVMVNRGGQANVANQQVNVSSAD